MPVQRYKAGRTGSYRCQGSGVLSGLTGARQRRRRLCRLEETARDGGDHCLRRGRGAECVDFVAVSAAWPFRAFRSRSPGSAELVAIPGSLSTEASRHVIHISIDPVGPGPLGANDCLGRRGGAARTALGPRLDSARLLVYYIANVASILSRRAELFTIGDLIKAPIFQRTCPAPPGAVPSVYGSLTSGSGLTNTAVGGATSRRSSAVAGHLTMQVPGREARSPQAGRCRNSAPPRLKPGRPGAPRRRVG
jgi:hypothetical protein